MLAAFAAAGAGLRTAAERQAAAQKDRPKAEELFDDLVKRAKKIDEDKANLQPGELARIHGGQNAMKGAIDIGDSEAVRTLADLDPLTVTAPCCPDGTPPLVYLRRLGRHQRLHRLLQRQRQQQPRQQDGGGSGRWWWGASSSSAAAASSAPSPLPEHSDELLDESGGGGDEELPLVAHPHAETMVPLLEGLALGQGFVPFADGCLVLVETLLEVLRGSDDDQAGRSEEEGEREGRGGSGGAVTAETGDRRNWSGRRRGGGSADADDDDGRASSSDLSSSGKDRSGGRTREEILKDKLLRGEVDFRQFKTLSPLQALPRGFEKENVELSFLIKCAQARRNPDGDPQKGGPDAEDDDDDGDLEANGPSCVVM